jgi:hypothetical protein
VELIDDGDLINTSPSSRQIIPSNASNLVAFLSTLMMAIVWSMAMHQCAKITISTRTEA